MENSTSYSYEQFNTLHLALFCSLAIPTWIINVAGNALVLVCVFREKKLHRASYYFIASLALADISFAIFGAAPLAYLVFQKTSLLCDATARFYLFIVANAASATSFFILILLTVERYCAVAFPVQHRKLITNRRTFGLIVCVWLFATFSAVALKYPYVHRDIASCPILTYEFAIYASSCGFVGCILLAILNFHLSILIKRRFRDGAGRERRFNVAAAAAVQNDAHDDAIGAKANKAVITIVFFFVACWLPQTVYCLVVVLSYHGKINDAVLDIYSKIFTFLFLLNGAINPVIYARQNPHLRSAFKKMLIRRRQNQIDDSPPNNRLPEVT